MKTLLREIKGTIPHRRFTVSFDFDNDCGIYGEQDFIEKLVFERKRSERSGKPFLLMLLTIAGTSEPRSSRDTIKAAREALSRFGRDTDIKGWYRRASTLGVIFTETDHIDLEILLEKIYRSLRAHLTEPQVAAMRISFHRYPDDENSAMPDTPGEFTFYPDYLEKERFQKAA